MSVFSCAIVLPERRGAYNSIAGIEATGQGQEIASHSRKNGLLMVNIERQGKSVCAFRFAGDVLV